MSMVRHYTMTARDGEGAALGQALERLGGQVAVLPGCEGVELYGDADDPAVYVFLERWTSVEAHKSGGAALGKEALGPVMAALAGPPQGRWLTRAGA